MIRVASRKDAKALYELESSVFSRDDFALSLSSFYYHIKHNELFVYESEGKLVAYILWLQRKNSYRLYSLCVQSEFRGEKIGQKLLSYSLERLKAKRYTLEVKTTNSVAITIYEKYAFYIQKRVVGFYKDSDAYVMCREESIKS